MRLIKKLSLKWLPAGIAVFLLAGILYPLTPFPTKEVTVEGLLPPQFAVPVNTGFERQGKSQCAAFSTAFVLRNLGQDLGGAEVYRDISYKIPVSGYVLPKGVITYLHSQGCRAAIYQEDLDSLKTRLVQGNKPLIVLVGNGLFWQHYMTLVGYDGEKKELYFFDSGREGNVNAALPGNRTMTEDYFQEWWSNGLPVFNHICITAEKI